MKQQKPKQKPLNPVISHLIKAGYVAEAEAVAAWLAARWN